MMPNFRVGQNYSYGVMLAHFYPRASSQERGNVKKAVDLNGVPRAGVSSRFSLTAAGLRSRFAGGSAAAEGWGGRPGIAKLMNNYATVNRAESPRWSCRQDGFLHSSHGRGGAKMTPLARPVGWENRLNHRGRSPCRFSLSCFSNSSKSDMVPVPSVGLVRGGWWNQPARCQCSKSRWKFTGGRPRTASGHTFKIKLPRRTALSFKTSSAYIHAHHLWGSPFLPTTIQLAIHYTLQWSFHKIMTNWLKQWVLLIRLFWKILSFFVLTVYCPIIWD